MTVLAVGIMALFAMFESGSARPRGRAPSRPPARSRTVRWRTSARSATLDRPPGRPGYSRLHPRTRATPRLHRDRGEPRRPHRLRDRALHDEGARADVDRGGRQKLPRRHLHTWQTIAAGRGVKLVTIVVRDAVDVNKTGRGPPPSFDESTGIAVNAAAAVRGRAGPRARELPQRGRLPGAGAPLARAAAVLVRELRSRDPVARQRSRSLVPPAAGAAAGTAPRTSPPLYPAVEAATAVAGRRVRGGFRPHGLRRRSPSASAPSRHALGHRRSSTESCPTASSCLRSP